MEKMRPVGSALEQTKKQVRIPRKKPLTAGIIKTTLAASAIVSIFVGAYLLFNEPKTEESTCEKKERIGVLEEIKYKIFDFFRDIERWGMPPKR